MKLTSLPTKGAVLSKDTNELLFINRIMMKYLSIDEKDKSDEIKLMKVGGIVWNSSNKTIWTVVSDTSYEKYSFTDIYQYFIEFVLTNYFNLFPEDEEWLRDNFKAFDNKHCEKTPIVFKFDGSAYRLPINTGWDKLNQLKTNKTRDKWVTLQNLASNIDNSDNYYNITSNNTTPTRNVNEFINTKPTKPGFILPHQAKGHNSFCANLNVLVINNTIEEFVSILEENGYKLNRYSDTKKADALEGYDDNKIIFIRKKPLHDTTYTYEFIEIRNTINNYYKYKNDEQEQNNDRQGFDESKPRRTRTERFEVSIGGCGDGLSTGNRKRRERSTRLGEGQRSTDEGLCVGRRSKRSITI